MSAISIPRFALAVAMPLAIPVALSGPQPTRGPEFAGTFTMRYEQQQPTPVGDADGHIILTAVAKGTNRSSGRTAFMDGAAVTQISLTEMTQGNGPDQGYIIEAKDGEIAVTRYSRRVKTTLADGKPVTTVEGTWTKVSGTGRYDGITGAGTYTGRLLSPSDFVVDWRGSMTLKERTVAR